MQNNIIIVAEAEIEKEAAQVLLNFISESGKYNAVLWETKHFKNNEPQISSGQKIIFIGDNEYASRNLSSIAWKYHELNMCYGWMGSVAVIQVLDGYMYENDREKFKDMCRKQKTEIEKITKSKMPALGPISRNTTKALLLGLLSPGALIVDLLVYKKERRRRHYIYLSIEFFFKALDSFIGDKKDEG